jgi:hypothetical protein
MIGEIQQQVDLPIRVSPGDPADLPKVFIIEPNEQIIVPIISPGHLPGLPGRIGNMVEIQLLPGPPVGVIANFLPTGSRRSDFISIGTMMLPDQFLHDKFRHGGTADVAMANKKYPHHGHKTPFYAKICRINAGLQVSPVHEEKDIILQKTAQFSPL